MAESAPWQQQEAPSKIYSSSNAAPTNSSGFSEASENKAQRQRRSTHAQATARLIARSLPSLFLALPPTPCPVASRSSLRCLVPCAVVLCSYRGLLLLVSSYLVLRHLAGCRRRESFNFVACGPAAASSCSCMARVQKIDFGWFFAAAAWIQIEAVARAAWGLANDALLPSTRRRVRPDFAGLDCRIVHMHVDA